MTRVRQVEDVLLFGFLNAPFDVADRLSVFIELDLILRSQLALEPCELFRDGVQDALVLP